MDDFLISKEGKQLEKSVAEIFEKIGLKCFNYVGQVQLNRLTTGYKDCEHIEIDYFIPTDKTCLVGEITSRNKKEDTAKNIKTKYKKFITALNILKSQSYSDDFWKQLGIKKEDLRYFRKVDSIKGFLITTTKEKYELNLEQVEEIAVFYRSDIKKLYEYSNNIGKWTKNYFLNNFGIEYSQNNSITIYENTNNLIKNSHKKISEKVQALSHLYTFAISPYQLLDIAHVYRTDELPSLETNNRPLAN